MFTYFSDKKSIREPDILNSNTCIKALKKCQIAKISDIVQRGEK